MNTLNRPQSCPVADCSSQLASRGDTARAEIIAHSSYKTARGKTRRWLCKSCGKTFIARHGTAYHRLRSSPATFDRAVQMNVEGMGKAAIGRLEGVSAATIGRWLERAARCATRLFDHVTRGIETFELQADEVRTYTWDRENRQYVFALVEVSSRLWLSREVGSRTRRNCRLLLRDARNRCAFGQPRVLIMTDPFKFYAPEIRRAWGPTCVHVESGKIIRGGRVIRVHNRLVLGSEHHLRAARERCEDSKKLNTAYIERLNLLIRRSLACMQRKTTSAAKTRAKLTEAIDLLRCYYNFVRPHGALKFGREVRTPAQQAGLVTKRLTFRDIFLSFGPMGRVAWIKNEAVRREWRVNVCASNNT